MYKNQGRSDRKIEDANKFAGYSMLGLIIIGIIALIIYV